MSNHHHPSDHAPASRGPGIFLVVGVLIILVAAIFAGIRLAGTGSATETEDAERAAVRLKNLEEVKAADTAQVTTYGWNDRAKGVVRIPVKRAMELVLPELNARSSKGGATATSPQTQP
jgi:hypothetical protein